MGVDAGFCMYDVVVKKFTFAVSSPDEFLFLYQRKESRRRPVGGRSGCTMYSEWRCPTSERECWWNYNFRTVSCDQTWVNITGYMQAGDAY